MNIIENNKLITDFMSVDSNGVVFQDKNTNKFYPIRYDSSWDWLVPVIEEIEKLGFIILIEKYSCSIKGINTDYNSIFLGTTKIKAVYDACVGFIKYYNTINFAEKE